MARLRHIPDEVGSVLIVGQKPARLWPSAPRVAGDPDDMARLQGLGRSRKELADPARFELATSAFGVLAVMPNW